MDHIKEKQREKALEEVATALEAACNLEKTEAEQLAESMIVLAESVNQFSVTLEEVTAVLNLMREESNQVVKYSYRNIYFDKPRIDHQVLSRKPRHLVKKIIR